MRLEWLGHAGFLIDADRRILIDPFETDAGPADVLLITHTHRDHLDLESLEKSVTPETKVFCSADAHSRLAKLEPASITMMAPGDVQELDGLTIEATHAYNLDKEFHPKDNDWLGFIVTIEGTRIFHTGDLDDLPELHGTEVDVLLVPVSGTYVMTADEAARFASKLTFSRAIPMHYGSIVGTEEDAQRFAEQVDARVPKRGENLLEGL